MNIGQTFSDLREWVEEVIPNDGNWGYDITYCPFNRDVFGMRDFSLHITHREKNRKSFSCRIGLQDGEVEESMYKRELQEGVKEIVDEIIELDKKRRVT